jgi:thiol-disulfide isomerase/thioredoxin
MVIADRSSSTVGVAAGHARVGGEAPNFTSHDLQGNRVSLSDFRSRPVLLTFWATWCTACREELPALQRLEQRYSSVGLKVLAVNYRETSNERMRQYLAGDGVTLQSVIDPRAAIATAYGVDVGLPVNIVVDRAGRVARLILGEVPVATIETTLDLVVAQVVAPGA